MKTIKVLSFFLTTIFFLSLIACNSSNSVTSKRGIQKRKYTKGYHSSLAWRKIRKESKSTEKDFYKLNIDKSALEEVLNKNSLDPQRETNRAIYASADNSPALFTKDIKTEITDINNGLQQLEDTSKCDLLIMKSGIEIDAKVLEVGTDEIRYKKCDNINGPTFTKNNKEIFMIKYANGSKSLFNEDKLDKEDNSEKAEEGVSIAAILGLVFGGLSFFLLGLPFSLAGVILSIIGIYNTSKKNKKGKVIAWIGYIVSLIALMIIIFSLSAI
jgi:transcriptional regulator of met regulon